MNSTGLGLAAELCLELEQIMNRRGPVNEFRIRLRGEFCLYCGMIADTGDHFPPVNWGRTGVIIPACRECNSLAGTNHPLDLELRVDHVKNKLRKRHKKALNMPVWDADDLCGVRGNMRRDVNFWQEKRRVAHARVTWGYKPYLATIVPKKAEDEIMEFKDLRRLAGAA